MANFAIVENGIVVNVVVADPELAAANGWILAGNASPGWEHDGSNFIPPPPPARTPPAPEETARARDRNLPDQVPVTIGMMKEWGRL